VKVLSLFRCWNAQKDLKLNKVLLLSVLLLSGCANYYSNLINKPVVVSRFFHDSKDNVAKCINTEVHKHFGPLTLQNSTVNNFGDISEVVVTANVGVYIIFTIKSQHGGSIVNVRSGHDVSRAIKTLEGCS